MVRHIALAAILLLVACTTAGFGYRHYYPRLVSYEGILIGPSPDQDIDAEKTCKPDERRHTKCVVMKLDEFLRLKSDFLRLQSDLTSCQRGS